MTAQIRDIADHVCNVAAGLARDVASLDASTHQTLRELGLVLDGDDAWATSSDRPGSRVHDSTQTREPVDTQCGNALTTPMSSYSKYGETL